MKETEQIKMNINKETCRIFGIGKQIDYITRHINQIIQNNY